VDCDVDERHGGYFALRQKRPVLVNYEHAPIIGETDILDKCLV
jgi:hypothetical protein